jgi:hypothetical protein
MNDELDLDIELTERARHVFLASRSTAAFNFKASSGAEVPGAGDEIQFPEDVAAVVFVVLKRRFVYGATDTTPTVKVWLDVADGAKRA